MHQVYSCHNLHFVMIQLIYCLFGITVLFYEISAVNILLMMFVVRLIFEGWNLI